MKVLFICSEFFDYTGNHARAFYNAIEQYVGENNITPFLFPGANNELGKKYASYTVRDNYSSLDKACNTILRGDPKVGANVLRGLKQNLISGEYDIVFLQRSTLGCLLKTIRNYSKAKIISYNPDVYVDYMKGKWSGNKLQFLKKILVYLNWLKFDKQMALNADANIVLNDRDRAGFIKYYKKEPDLILPLFCIDKFNVDSVIRDQQSEHFIILFVGSLFWPNVEGIEWFIEKVMQKLPRNVELKIVGNNMESLASNELFDDSRINLIGSVDKTGPFYYEADLVVAPIFSGTGMKNKTAEALMYGKQFLAAPEALTGYEGLDDHCCRTADDFINRINDFVKHRPAKYDENLRKLFLQNYSINAVSERLGNLFEKVLERNEVK